MCCLYPTGSQESDSSQTAKKDMLAALRARQEALEETLRQRLEELKSICIREAVWENTDQFGKYFEIQKHSPALLFWIYFPAFLLYFPRSWQESFLRNILWIRGKNHPQWDGRSVPPLNWTSRKFFLRERWRLSSTCTKHGANIYCAN